MLYIFLGLIIMIFTPILSIFWQALILFLSAKILGVAGNTYFKSIKIILWTVLLYFPATLIYFILKWMRFPLVEILGGSIAILIYFMVIHVLCQKYYNTGAGRNLAIILISLIANFISALIITFLIILPLGFWAYKNSSVSSDGSNSVFHMDQSFEDTAKATINFGSGKMKWKH